MTSSVSGFQNSLQSSYGQQVTPFRSSYANLSGNDLMSLASAQSSYNPQAPQANAQTAENYLQSAMQATDPALTNQLLERALDLIVPGGSQRGGGARQPLTNMPTVDPGNLYNPGNGTCGGSGLSGPGSPGVYGGGSSGVGSYEPSQGSGLSVNGNTIDTGRYSISGSKNDDGSLTVTDKDTGKSFEVWGDPHIKEDGKDVADFQKDNLNIQLQDGSVIHMQPGEMQNGVAHLDQVSVTKGDQSVTMGGQDGSFANGVMTSQVMGGTGNLQSSMYNAAGTDNITYGADDMLHNNNNDGSMGGIISGTNGGETNLDGVGGGLVGQPSNPGTSGPGGNGGAGGAQPDTQQLLNQLMSAIQQYVGGFDQFYMQDLVSKMMNQSGFQQADQQAG